MLMEDETPIFFMYWQWIGDTLLNDAKLKSKGLLVSGLSSGTIGTGL